MTSEVFQDLVLKYVNFVFQMSQFPRPSGTKPRRAEALVKGKEYKLTFVAQEKSKFLSRTNEEVYKTIAVYKDFGMLFHTSLPYEFDKNTEQDVAQYNNNIKANKNIRLVYYGKISRCLQIEILQDGEGNLNSRLLLLKF